MKAIDIIHKQVTHTVVLLIEVVKQLENEKIDSVSLRQNKRIYLMQQLVNVLSWIQELNPQQINYDHLILPDNLKPLHEFAKTAISEFPKASKLRTQPRPSVESSQNSYIKSRNTFFPTSNNVDGDSILTISNMKTHEDEFTKDQQIAKLLKNNLMKQAPQTA